MLSIDGLVTGLDTASIIEGLLQIQQRQIDTLNGRRATVLSRQTAFSGVEARLLSFRGALGRLTSGQSSTLRDKIVASSNEDLIKAAASDDAATGVYRLRVEQLATSHQIASFGFTSAEAELGEGDVNIQVGDGEVVNIKLDSDNSKLQDVVDAINASDAKVTASLINDGSGDSPYRLLLTADEAGTANEISISTDLSGGEPLDFNLLEPVEAAANSLVRFGSGAGAIVVESGSNQIEGLIAGVTLSLQGFDTNEEVTLTVRHDTEAGVAAVEGFVNAYNDFVSYVNDQIRYNSETDTAGALLGDRSVTSIQDDLAFTLTGIVGGLRPEMSRLSAVGISVGDDGTLTFDSRKLEDVLDGRVDGLTADDAARLFSLSGASSRNDLSFVVGSTATVEGNFEVDITAAATKAAVTGQPLSIPLTIDATNDTLSLVVDGQVSSTLTLAHGDYASAEDLATHLQAVINADDELSNREVTVAVENGGLQIESRIYGSSSNIKLLSGNAWASLGFVGDEISDGQDVAGRFIVNGEIEEATGRGTLLIGNEDNANTADLQVRVNLDPADVDPLVVEGSITVTRGFASRLDKLIGRLTDEDGPIGIANQRFDDTDASILASIERLTSQFEAQQQTLIQQFAALESAVGQLQTTGNFLSAQFAGLSGLSI